MTRDDVDDHDRQIHFAMMRAARGKSQCMILHFSCAIYVQRQDNARGSRIHQRQRQTHMNDTIAANRIRNGDNHSDDKNTYIIVIIMMIMEIIKSQFLRRTKQQPTLAPMASLDKRKAGGLEWSNPSLPPDNRACAASLERRKSSGQAWRNPSLLFIHCCNSDWSSYRITNPNQAYRV